MKRLILCCDGTWNTPDQEDNNQPAPTNVVRLYNALCAQDAAGTAQVKYYHSGVGTEGSQLSRTAGGAEGAGLDKIIEVSYQWLADNYVDGDEIYLFGFSRGAYTARSLGGLLHRCGLPVTAGLSPSEAWTRVDTAYQKGYQNAVPYDTWRDAAWPWFAPGAVPIKLIGVWDTVGARGIPDDLAVLNLFDDPETWRFYDTTLSAIVKNARHALAVDERRAIFTPTLWTDANGAPVYTQDLRVKQVWFPGVHSDVGGGYSACGLSDRALQWMMDEAAALGLAFEAAYTSQIVPNAKGQLHDSATGIFAVLPTRPRAIPCLEAAAASTPFDASALARQKSPPITQAPYHPTRKLAVGESAEVIVLAATTWNEAELYLEARAEYAFTAVGQWFDSSISCNPAGDDSGKFQIGEIAQGLGAIMEKAEWLFRKLTDDEKAKFFGTRRIEAQPWFSLVGAIANDGLGNGVNPLANATTTEHQYLPIGAGPYALTVTKPGYLYAFANDAWNFYGNNHGSVKLTVKRVT